MLASVQADPARGGAVAAADSDFETTVVALRPPPDPHVAPAPSEGGDEACIGRYRIERTLGTGGLGTVHEAWDPLLSRRVALKTLHLDADAGQRLALERLFLAEARAETGLAIITEVMTPSDVELVAQYTDIFQIGARNSQNYLLLEEVGKAGKPVMLKRGLSMLIEEWILAAEYVMAQGNPDVMLCERGIRTYETSTRNTLDVSAVPVVKKLSHLPILIDPSHAAGKRAFVGSLSLAAIAAGADGLMIEAHPDPDHALSDGAQSISIDEFQALMPRIAAVAAAIGRPMPALATVAD